MDIINVTAESFEEEVLGSDKPVLVDFFATWCGPCKMLSPLVSEIASERDDVKVCKIDVDEEQEIAIKYGISSIPTLIVFKNGEIAAKGIGFMPKNKINDLINC